MPTPPASLTPPQPPQPVPKLSVLLGSLAEPRKQARRTAAQEVIDELHRSWPREPAAGPHLAVNMISTADGRATIKGRSGPIGNRADSELFHGLRELADAVLIGAGTLRVERYNRIVDAPEARERRRRRGLAEEPWSVILSRSLAIDPGIALLADPSARVVILTPSQGEPLETAAPVEYLRAPDKHALDLRWALGELSSRYGIGRLLCEGGPHLTGELLAAGLVDELFLTLAPKLGGWDGDGLEAQPGLAIVAGSVLDPPVPLELLWLLESESYLFLRYRVLR